MANVLAIAEQRDGGLKAVSHEVVTAARMVADGIGGEVEALLVGGPGTGGAAESLGTYGADRIRAVEHDALASYNPEGYAAAIAEQARGGDYFAILFPATAAGRDLAPRVAAKLDVPLATEVTGLEVEEGELVITRPQYAGKVFAELTLEATPRIVSLRGNVFRAEEKPRDAAVETVEPTVDPDTWKVRIREVQEAAGSCFYTPTLRDANLLLVGTGTGLAPLWGIVREALRQGHRGEIRVMHGAVECDGLYLHQDLQRLAERHDNLHYHASVLRPEGCSAVDARPLDELVVATIGDFDGWHSYLCGAPELVNQLRKRIVLAGARMDAICADVFLPTAPAENPC